MPTLLIQGQPEYVYGKKNTDAGPTVGPVISNSINGAGTTATLTFLITSGNVPLVGSLVTVIGTSNSSGAFNVTNAMVLSVSMVADTNGIQNGQCSITFTVSSSVQATTADAGQVYIEIPVVPDDLTATIVTNLATNAGASAPVAAPMGSIHMSGRSISVTVSLFENSTVYPSTLTGVTVVLQGANSDFDSEYNTIGTIITGGSAGNVYDFQSGEGNTSTGTLAAGSVTVPNFRFYRLCVTAATGAGYLSGKILM